MRWQVLVAVSMAALALAVSGGTMPDDNRPAAPAFTHSSQADWLNTRPLALESLRGKVVLVEFWTFACHNCYRSIPWLKALHARFREQGLQIVGVHTPEFPHERVRANVERKIAEYGIAFPVMLDNDFSYWNALASRYWPAFYLIDKRGRLRAHYAGETHPGDAQARGIEAAVQALLAEPG